jgi:hypothetical protein
MNMQQHVRSILVVSLKSFSIDITIEYCVNRSTLDSCVSHEFSSRVKTDFDSADYILCCCLLVNMLTWLLSTSLESIHWWTHFGVRNPFDVVSLLQLTPMSRLYMVSMTMIRLNLTTSSSSIDYEWWFVHPHFDIISLIDIYWQQRSVCLSLLVYVDMIFFY